MIDELKQLISKYPRLLNLKNKNSERLAIFYAVKNRQFDTSLFLFQNGQRLHHGDIHSMISKTKSPSKDYLFFMELSKRVRITEELIVKNGQTFDEWIFNSLKNHCFSHNQIEELENLLKIKGGEIKWGDILTEYRIYKGIGNKLQPNQFTRDLTLKYLLDEKES